VGEVLKDTTVELDLVEPAPDSTAADAGPEVAPDIQPSCPDPLPTGCVTLEYQGPDKDPTEYPLPAEFHELVDSLFSKAEEDNELISLNREEFPVWDFQEGEGGKGRLIWEWRIRHLYFDIPGFLDVFQSRLKADAGDIVALLSFLSDKTDTFVDEESIQPYLERVHELVAEPDAPERSLQALYALAGEEFGWSAHPLSPLPEEYQLAFARYFFSIHLALSLQQDAFHAATAQIPITEELWKKASISRSFNDLAEPDGLEAFGKLTDFRQLYRGSQLLSAALDRLAEDLKGWEMMDKYEFPTPFGLVSITGTAPDVHVEQEPGYLAIVDLGGNDDYWGSIAASKPGLPISVILDLDGDDQYEITSAEATFAAGYLGYGMLWDIKGDDTYVGRYSSLAGSCLGVAVLNDEEGEDSYDSVSASQASAMLGLALLMDGAGNDNYYSFRASQAYAGYRGAALLLDAAGSDVYDAEAELVLYPSAQNPKYNANMSQGAGQGYRNDEAGMENTYAGGIAMLVDLAGNDVYKGGLFNQGVGYWFGIGFLIDSGGDDSYSGIWYNFGSAAHFAGGVHLDSDGDDDYFCLQDQCMGEGRDYSLGFMANMAGSDHYHAKGGRNIGAGDLFGAGIFWDPQGEDAYVMDQPWGIGHVYSEMYNENSLTFGMFMDTGGTADEYTSPADHPGDEEFWTQLGNDNDGEYTNVIAIGSDQ